MKVHSPFRERSINGHYYDDFADFFHRSGLSIIALIFGLLLSFLSLTPLVLADAFIHWETPANSTPDHLESWGQWDTQEPMVNAWDGDTSNTSSCHYNVDNFYQAYSNWNYSVPSGADYYKIEIWMNGSINTTQREIPTADRLWLKFISTNEGDEDPDMCYWGLEVCDDLDCDEDTRLIGEDEFSFDEEDCPWSMVINESRIWWGYEYNNNTCSQYTEGLEACGGYNMQFILTCEDDDGHYGWAHNRTFCKNGCLYGECLVVNTTCADACVSGQTRCQGDYVVNCTDSLATNCTVWNNEYQEFCEHGCLSGNCITNVSTCAYGDMDCSNSVIMNCTLGSTGFWSFSQLETCEYGCLFHYNNDTVYCQEIGDAHPSQAALEELGEYFLFIFAAFLGIAFIGGSLFFVGVFMKSNQDREGTSKIGPMILIGLLAIGTFMAIVPVWVFVVVFILGMFWIFKGGGR
jgi:hypothetical protein